LTNLQVYSPSSRPAVSGCEAVAPADVLFDPPESAYVDATSGWSSVSDFNVVVRPGWNWTLMAVRCRGRHFPSCYRVPSNSNNTLADWRVTVPEVPHQPLWVVYFVLASHALVFLGVHSLRRGRAYPFRAPEPESEPEPLLSAA